MDIEQFRKAGYQAIDRICEYYYTLEGRPVASQVQPGYLREALPSDAPKAGEDFQKIADDYQRLIVPGLAHWQHPSFFAYFPTACTFEGMLADLYASSACNPGFNWSSSPACTELEAIVMDWAAKLLGLAPHFFNISGTGGGVIQTTASDAALVSIVAARSRFSRKHPHIKQEDLLIYTTTQTHSLGLKAGLVLGIPCRALEVTAQDNFALKGATLRTSFEEDSRRGKYAFIVIVTVGTTSSGAIDRLEEIGQVVQSDPSMWVHVDAAWAGVALACPEFRDAIQLNSINQYADSFCTNFHKWGLVNFDASALWVRDRKNLTDALDITPEFLRSKHGDEGTVIDYRNWHLGLGRRFRSLKLWFILRSYGQEGFRKHIRQGVALNKYFVALLRPPFALVTEPSLSLTVFRLEPTTPELSNLTTPQTLDKLNRAFYARISARPDILLTQTVINGIFCIRFAVGAARTEQKHVDKAWELLQGEADAAINAWMQDLENNSAESSI